MDIEIDDDRLGGARIEETDWGYVLHGLGASALRHAAKTASLGLGVAAIFTAVGLWVLPGSTFTAELLPLKLAVTGFLFLIGCFFVQLAQTGGRAEVQVDHLRRELRAVERGGRGADRLLAIWPFDVIGGVDVSCGRFIVSDRDGAVLAELQLGGAPGMARRAAVAAQPA